jgi:hypothetical protein
MTTAERLLRFVGRTLSVKNETLLLQETQFFLATFFEMYLYCSPEWENKTGQYEFVRFVALEVTSYNTFNLFLLLDGL